MMDVNYVEYGNNAIRVLDTGVAGSGFLAENGFVIGVAIAILICIVLILVVFIMGAKSLSKLLP